MDVKSGPNTPTNVINHYPTYLSRFIKHSRFSKIFIVGIIGMVVSIVLYILINNSLSRNFATNISCDKVDESNRNIENAVIGIFKMSENLSDNEAVETKDLYSKNRDIFIHKDNILIRKEGGEMENITRYSLSGKIISSCENTWAIGNINNQSNPSCNIPTDSIVLSQYFEQRKNNCLK